MIDEDRIEYFYTLQHWQPDNPHTNDGKWIFSNFDSIASAAYHESEMAPSHAPCSRGWHDEADATDALSKVAIDNPGKRFRVVELELVSPYQKEIMVTLYKKNGEGYVKN